MHLKIVEDDPLLPENAMQQWMRLNTCLNMVQSAEHEKGVAYTHIIKLRTDYYCMDPTEMLPVIGEGGPGLTACSDKIFAGDRDTMMLFREFFNDILDYHVDRDHWFPVNIMQIMRSADSFKWFGLLFPAAMLKRPLTPAAFRSLMMDPGPEAASESYRKIMNGRAVDHPEGCRLMHTLYDISPKGKKVFASEICFAAFLNSRDVTVTWEPCLSGVLWQDRSEDPGTDGRSGENLGRSYPENRMKD